MAEVKVYNAVLEDDKDTGQIVLRGTLDQDSLKYIKLDWYQREQGFSTSHTQQIVGAYFQNQTATVEDITLGMRGERHRGKGTNYVLLDPIYCINGGQRLFAAALAMKDRSDVKIALGFKLYFNTNEKFENDLFCKLGTTAVRIHSSVLLRNKKKESRAAAILVRLNNNPKFALNDKVSWDQRKSRHQLMTGKTLAHIVGILHSHKGASLKSNKNYELLDGLDNLVGKIGPEDFENNVIKFFDVIDNCWPIRNLAGDGAPRPHLRHMFLTTLARLFSAYSDFWDGKDRAFFRCPPKFISKLKRFRLDQYVRSGVVPKEALYEMLRKQLSLNPIFEEDQDEAAE